jgi:hypothetical protein
LCPRLNNEIAKIAIVGEPCWDRRHSPLQELASAKRSVSYHWGKATIVNDHPDKVATSSRKTETMARAN